MKKSEILEELLKSGNGYLFTKDVVAKGISKTYLAKFVKKMNLEHVAIGVYMNSNEWKDDLYLLYLKSPKAIYSHETALFLHGLMEREPTMICMSVSQEYNATHLRQKGVKIFQVRENRVLLGKIEILTSLGNKVAVYDKERTICDIIQRKESMDIQVFQTAMKEYAASKDKNLSNLMKYAFLFGVEEEVRRYTEVLL